MRRETYTIDAAEKVLGRLASEIAILLRGKNKSNFVPYKDEGGIVKVINASKLKLTGKKVSQKVYYRHSGYMGGLKTTPFEKIFDENPALVLKKAVYGMLPVNKLRAKMMKRLIIER